MHFSKGSLGAFCLTIVGASALSTLPRRDDHVSRSGMQWHACGLSSTNQLNQTRPILCGSLAVPLDYSDPASTATINLPLLKIAATSRKKDTILINYGGPGADNTVNFEKSGAELQGIVGPDHDLVTWYPRGTNGDLLFSCYANATARAAAQSSNPIVFGNASNVAEGELWADGQVTSDACAQMQPQNGSLIGTAFTARDAIQIADALGEDGLIRYYGFSYGTALGSVIAAMFPERIDKLVLDGVVNAHEYFHGLILSSRESSNDVLFGFARGCVQNAHICLSAYNRTAIQVYDSILDMFQEAKVTPLVFPLAVAQGGDLTVSYTSLKGMIYSFLYSPGRWRLFAELLHGIETRNAGTILNYFASLTGQPPVVDAEASPGIQCGDTFARASTLDAAITKYLEPFQDNSFSDIDHPAALTCARWPFAAKERYSGDFVVKTRKPLLVISNTWDPATPLSSGKNASAGFEGSVLLEQRGYGHVSNVQASLCTTRRIRNYFNHGTLPQVGTICKVDEPLLPANGGDSTWAWVLEELASSSNNGTTLSG